MADRNRIEPPEVVAEVEAFVSKTLHDAEAFDNSEPLDESNIWSLHAMAADIYAMGWKAGEAAAAEKAHRANRRERDRAASTEETQ